MKSVKKKISFKCRNCNSRAQVVTVDGQMERVECSICGNSVEGENARIMYRTLAQRLNIQIARNESRKMVMDSGLGRIPPTRIDSEFSDAKWPFIFVVKGDV